MRLLNYGLVGVMAVVLCSVSVVRGEEESEWQKNAAKAVKALVDDSVALKIRSILHPTGDGGELKSVTTEADDEGILVMITISWRGGITGTAYTTTVRWRFTKSGHVSSKIDSDTAVIKAKEANINQMDDLLRKKLYPLVKEAIKSL